MEQDNGTSTNPLLEIVYLICWDDEYELPVYLAESIKEIRQFFRISHDEAVEMINTGKTRFGLKIEKVEYEETDT